MMSTTHLLSVDQHLAAQGLGAAAIVLIAAASIGYVIFFVAALLSVLAAPVGCFGKLIWFIVILCLPFLGSLLWFVAGRPRDY
ncbi:MAG TPA: PLD nuclease N-terminal domain-containing protein [Pseudonocardiaceae bacterium]|nr:PLD nuclease N-terminal domain-containing protein [Pseudonocardiaceae bacterium]